MKQRNKNGFIPLLLLTALSAALLNACATKAQSEDRTQPVATSASSAASASDAIDEASVVKITLRGDRAKIEGRGAAVEKGVLVIHEGGSYRLEGESRIPIEVRAANVSVLLYLNGVKIHTRGKNAIRAVQRGELGLVFEGDKASEIVTDGRTDKKGEALEPDNIRAAVYSKGNLYLAGSGSAVITAADQGFVAKEELLVTEGAYDIETEDDIFRGKESVDLLGGVVRASARGEKGKGVSSEGAVTLAGGSYVFAYTSEGIEGKTIEMSGGSFDISADDDGMNARELYDKEQTETKKKEANPEVWVHISGGELHVTAGGDGIDSNGDLIFSGGMSFVNGSDNGKDAALDWNGSCRVDGGVLIASGMKARAEKISPESAQPFFEWELKSEHPQQEQISVQRSDGSTLYWELPRRAYDYVQISCPELTEENTLHGVAGNESIALR